MIIGSKLGAFLANLFDATFVNVVYIIIALHALILMFIKVESRSEEYSFNKPLLVIIGLFIGIISGILGVDGAFYYYSNIVCFIKIINKYGGC